MTTEPGHTQVLRALGTGGLIAGLLACFFIGWWGLLLAVGLFVGSAVLDATIDSIEQAVREHRKP